MPRRTARLVQLLVLFCLALGALAAPSQAYIFFGNFNEDAVGRLHSDGSHVETEWLKEIHNPIEVANANGRVYWASHEGTFDISTTVGYVNTDGSGFKADIFKPDIAPGFLAIGGERLYVAGDTFPPCLRTEDHESPENSAELWSARASDGGDEQQLVSTACLIWSGLAATATTVYWIDEGYETWPGNEYPTIKWMEADGDTPHVAVGSADLESPAGLTTDGEYIYWFDLHRMGRAKIAANGSVEDVEPEFITGLGEPGYPTTDGSYIYWAEARQAGQTILRADKADGGNVTTLATLPNSQTDDNIIYGLTATEPEAKAAVDRESIAFGSREVGSGPSQWQTVIMTSSGEENLSASSLELSGPNAKDFSLQSSCTQPVQTPGACAVVVRFEPQAPGKRTATLTIANNAVQSPIEVALSGSGLGPAIAISPSSADFGDWEVKKGATPPKAFEIENTGNEPLSVSQVALVGGANFSLESDVKADCMQAPIVAGQSCTVELSFNPASVGEKSAQFTVIAKAPAAPASATTTLSGTGTEPGLTIAPGSLQFGVVAEGDTSAVKTVTISNPGTAPLEVKEVFSTLGQFQTSSSCATLAPGASCEVEVSFAPTSVGAKQGRLEVVTDYFGPNAVTLLSGTAVSPEVSLTPLSADLGSRNAGSGPGAVSTFTFKSTGSETIEVESVGLGGDDPGQFVLPEAADTCTGATLESGEECSVGVAFDPSQAGPLAATLEIDDDAFAEPHTALLEGTGTKPLIALSTGSLAFPQLLSGSSSSQTFSVGNPGSGPLTITGAELGGPGADAYTVDASACTADPIPAGTANGCTIEVRFAPGAAGLLDATVELVSDASSGADTVGLGGVSCPVLSAGASGLKPPHKYAMALRLETSVAATAELNATLRYRFKGKTHAFALGARTVSSGGDLVFAIPRKLRKRIPAGKRVNLLLEGSASPAEPAGCGAQAVIDQALSLRVGR